MLFLRVVQTEQLLLGTHAQFPKGSTCFSRGVSGLESLPSARFGYLVYFSCEGLQTTLPNDRCWWMNEFVFGPVSPVSNWFWFWLMSWYQFVYRFVYRFTRVPVYQGLEIQNAILFKKSQKLNIQNWSESVCDLPDMCICSFILFCSVMNVPKQLLSHWLAIA